MTFDLGEFIERLAPIGRRLDAGLLTRAQAIARVRRELERMEVEHAREV
jgi:hypothetical protein